MASVPTGQERLREAPTNDLFRRLLTDVRVMVERQTQLAKLELEDKASGLRVAGVLMATAAVVACSKWLIVPTLIGTPNTSSIACRVVRFDKRYAPVHSATVACTRGPYVPLGTPAGQGARVVSPHAGHAS